MSLTTPFPEPDSPELERFAIYSRSEIAAWLRQLRDKTYVEYRVEERG